jgi:hypothetical protein
MIKKLKTFAIAMLATGATVTATHAAAIVYASTNLFQPLGVTLSVYEQKAIGAASGTSTVDTIVTGAAASFKTANLLTAVTNTLGVGFSKKALLGYITLETNTIVSETVNSNSPILGTNAINTGTNTIGLSTNIVPLVTTTSNIGVVTNVFTTTNTFTVITNALGGDGSITNPGVPATNITFITNGFTSGSLTTNAEGAPVTNTLAIGDSGSNTITISIGTNATSNLVTNIVVTTATTTNTFTNLSQVSLNGDTAVVGTNTLSVETNTSLVSALATNAVGIDTNAVTIETNGVAYTNLVIGTNAVVISTTNVVGTNGVTNVAVKVGVGTTEVTISTNVLSTTNSASNTVTFVTALGTNAGTTNSFTNTVPYTNLVLVGSEVVVSNGTTLNFGTNSTLTDSLTTTVTVLGGSTTTNAATNFAGVSTNFVATTNFTTNAGVSTNEIISTNEIVVTNQVFTTNLVVATNAAIATSTTDFSETNVVVTNGFNLIFSTNAAPPGPAELVVQDAIGAGATASFSYTSVPASILAISNSPSTNDLLVATIKSTTTNSADWSIKTLTLHATNVTLTLQGLVHSTLDYAAVASAGLTGKKIAVTNEAWTDVTGYGTVTNAPVVVAGTVTVGTPTAEKKQ